MSNSKKKPFPWKCQNCREKAVYEIVTPYETNIEHDGRSYHIQIAELKTPKCEKCGFVQLDAEADEAILREFRKQARLLLPEQIRGNREDLELTQKEFASALGINEATVSRWENAVQIQQKSLDKLMRLFFCHPDVRQLMIDQRLECLDYTRDATIGRLVNAIR
jgi:putative zinc finger/helix-turn-helix YgiT family protein